jgi:hypothetical protein
MGSRVGMLWFARLDANHKGRWFLFYTHLLTWLFLLVLFTLHVFTYTALWEMCYGEKIYVAPFIFCSGFTVYELWQISLIGAWCNELDAHLEKSKLSFEEEQIMELVEVQTTDKS